MKNKDFLRNSVVSQNMTKNSEWWREKIKGGIYICKKKLAIGEEVASSGKLIVYNIKK